MSEHKEETEDISSSPETGSDVVSLIKKMQQQLNYLEKKIDLLLGGGQSSERPFREKRFDRPSRPSFGHGPKRDFDRGPRRDFDRGPKRDFGHGPKRDFDRPKRDFAPREGGFDRPQSGGFGKERSSERGFDRPFARKAPGESRGGFGHGDKPFFRHRKGPR